MEKMGEFDTTSKNFWVREGTTKVKGKGQSGKR